MSDDRPRVDASQPLSVSLQAAVAAADEERFTSLVEAVLHEPDEAAVGLLAPFLGESAGIGRVAAHGMLMLGPCALNTLLAGLASENSTARLNAAWALGSMRDRRAADALLEVVTDMTSTPELIEASLESLAELSERRVVPHLRELLREAEFVSHRASICRALGCIGDVSAIPDILPLLEADAPDERLRAAEALIRLLDKRGWPVLFEILRGEDRHGDSMVAALRDLGDLSSALTSFVGDDQYQLRRDAAELLGTFGDTRAVPHLLDALRDINPWVRGAAAYSLGRLKDRRAVRHLLTASEDSSSWVRQCAIRALGLIGDTKALRTLERFLFDADADVAAAVQEALGVAGER
ncbi:MAG TPA: HEAT repeat domain-containing protein [Oscillatoriaceae cyanobacterium]